MRIAYFTHSLVSDWNHGNAHFLRGVVCELLAREVDVSVFEPAEGWSRLNLISEEGKEPLRRFSDTFPQLRSIFYDPATVDLGRELAGVDLVLVHEWNPPELVAAVGRYRSQQAELRALFHDTHHRAATQPEEMSGYDLRHYDGVLAFGESLRAMYVERGWAQRAWTWHEAADTRLFYPRSEQKSGRVVWVGNWGDDERTEELEEFLLAPVRDEATGGTVYGVRYPPEALQALEEAGLTYGGWLANYEVPAVFARHDVTVHVPRRP